MPQEAAVRKRWCGAVSNAVAARRRTTRTSVTQLWLVGLVRAMGGFTRPQTTKISGGETLRSRTQATAIGNLRQQASRPPSTLAHWDCDTDGEVEDLTNDSETAPPSVTCPLGCVSTAQPRLGRNPSAVTGMEPNRLTTRLIPQRASSIRRGK